MRNYQLRYVALLALVLFGCVRSVSSQVVTRANALGSVKISAAEGWSEAVSDGGRFRILFPNLPKIRSEDPGLNGFNLTEPKTSWFAYYSDFPEPRKSDDASLRKAYRSSVEELTIRNQAQIVSQKDVRLNGRLGMECILVNSSGVVSYMRGFLYLRRMYTLEVDRRGEITTQVAIPSDVEKFFDSFTYWDIN